MSTVEPSPGERILVLGAGELGLAMLKALSRNGRRPENAALSVLLRQSTIDSNDQAKQREVAALRDLGVCIEPGDVAIQSISDLAAIFSGFDTVVSCVGFSAGGGTQLKIAHAVLKAGVKRYFPWQFGVDYDVIGRGSPQNLFDEQLDVRDLLRDQDRTDWVIVSTGMFTSFVFERSFGVVDLPRRTVHALGDWDNAVTLTTPEDIGALTADIAFAVPRISNKVVYLAGDTITYRALADLVDSILAIKVQRVVWPLATLVDQLRHDPDNAMKKYRAVFAQGIGVAWDRDGTYNVQHGIEMTTAEQWLRANLGLAHM